MFKSVDIFEARKGGYKTYRVPGITVSKNNVVWQLQSVGPFQEVIGILMMYL